MKRLLLFLALILIFVPTARAADVTLPARGCFHYQWMPETWTVNGQHVSGDDSAQPDDGFHPTLGFYNSSSSAVTDAQATQLKWAKCEVPILTWWGQGRHSEQVRIPLFLDRSWITTWGYLKPTVLYECEGDPATGTPGCPGAPNPSVAQIQTHLAYLTNYALHSRWAWVNGKPLIFVYSSGDAACEVASRWKAAAPNWYVALKLSSGFRDCVIQPDAWFQYGPSTAYHHHAGYYCNVSPGFWRADEAAPRLARNLSRFKADVAACKATGEPWQLVTSYSEWGEGTAVENATEWDDNPTFGDYIGALASDGL